MSLDIHVIWTLGTSRIHENHFCNNAVDVSDNKGYPRTKIVGGGEVTIQMTLILNKIIAFYTIAFSMYTSNNELMLMDAYV